MGRSLVPITDPTTGEQYDATNHNPFDALGSRWEVERRGKRVWHKATLVGAERETLLENEMEVHFVIGSGNQGHSYLTNRDGYLFQTPISWFTRKQIWDKSPGFQDEERTGRPITAECLFCHANRVHPIEGSRNRFETPVFDGYAIGCERCHGPGEQHVENPGRRDPETQIDFTIVNPRWLAPELRQSVCEQCHLEGDARIIRRGRELYDFRPGLPFDSFWSVFVRASESPADHRAVHHVEQLAASRCYQLSQENPSEGKRKLGCGTCHNPHDRPTPEDRVSYFRKQCLGCHGDRGCSLPAVARLTKNKEDSCIDCHMPRFSTTDIAHAASTDHRIIVRAESPPVPGEQSLPAEGLPLVEFHTARAGASDNDSSRDLGLALVHLINQGRWPSSRLSVQALTLLDAALEKDPEDLDAVKARADILAPLNRRREALMAYEAIIARSPRRETSLAGAAQVASELRQWELALSYARRLVAINPWIPDYRRNLILILSQLRLWDDIQTESQAWMRLDSTSIDARIFWIASLIRKNKNAEADAEFAKVELLRPAHLNALQDWFARQARGEISLPPISGQ
jgi:tetratricopeptide (TPR) repeat protein